MYYENVLDLKDLWIKHHTQDHIDVILLADEIKNRIIDSNLHNQYPELKEFLNDFVDVKTIKEFDLKFGNFIDWAYSYTDSVNQKFRRCKIILI